ncbi:TRAP-type C4-dicarboxylate transport system permease large subunit [Lipingzhangella halophila]|uniref:TRAP-type C4-dicarboxylate transport system permease large subunit n=1 Tax=Lipingzhangella halophila TaxID=1783352 RepID=A0A7W7RFP6_9ACTN|nr:TRAP transporter large permease [Lipingzhangella halophila]MBB4931119.1 TRAP-type C4-dicarboxylate transport system permease large subunit [Lipingzhangella halophila]
MSGLTIGAIVGLILLILLAVGVPVAFALGLTALFAIVLFLTPAQFGFFGNFVFDSLDSFALLAIPLFILMGTVFGRSKASEDLLEAAHMWLGRIRGGLAMSSVVACAMFAALTGSSPATSAAIGKIAIPEMVRRGYPKDVATGAIVAGGTLGILIPPSVTLILYGISTEQSIGQLFLGGVAPGILITLLFCVWIFVALTLKRARTGAPVVPAAVGAGNGGGDQSASTDETPRPIAEAEQYSLGERLRKLVKVLPFLALIACVLAAMYLGIATPSEAAAVGALAAFVLVAVVYRSLGWKKIRDIGLETTRTGTMVLMIVVFSSVLGQVLSFLGVPQELAEVVAGLDVNRWVVFLAMNAIFLVLGFFIPPVAIILITMPVLFPIITELGFDPIWFGVVMTLNMEMGLITPPVGLNLYVVQGIAPRIPLRDILFGALPYVGVLALAIVILCFFPDLVTWLPNQMLGT